LNKQKTKQLLNKYTQIVYSKIIYFCPILAIFLVAANLSSFQGDFSFINAKNFRDHRNRILAYQKRAIPIPQLQFTKGMPILAICVHDNCIYSREGPPK
jgi:hypothetical protein